MAFADTVNASSSSSDVFYEDTKKYDVYLSFRGSDSRINFTDHLYSAMIQKGLRTWTEDELRRGESIHSALVRAIEESKIAVVVFSPNYASSVWCLTELAVIVKCMEEKKLRVLPIFHGVDPSDVRKQTGSFGYAFAEFEKRGKDKIEDVKNVNLWRDALTKVANISGCVLKRGNPEGQFLDEFIKLLSNQMSEEGFVDWELPPRYDDYIDDADDVMQEAHVVPDDVADAPQEAHVVPDDVANAPQEAHVMEDHVANSQREAHVVEDHVANSQREAHVVEDHVANSQRLCPICDNAIGVAFCCGHLFCVECGERYSTCPVCRDRVHIRFRVF
ncbi:hypothetical protein ACJW30_11G004500 [Castanea mollissima]